MARFFGMGFDSYRIVNTLYRDPFFTSIEGSTGLLRMDTQGRIHRDLPFAQFRGRNVELLEDVTPADGSLERSLFGPGSPEPVADFLR